MNSVRNLTNTNNQARKRSDNYDTLQKKFEKYVDECKSASSDDNPYGSEQNYMSERRDQRGFRYGTDGGTYPEQYGETRSTYRSRGDTGNVDERLTYYGTRGRPRNNCDEQDNNNNNNNNQNDRFDGNHGENFNYARRNSNPFDTRDRFNGRGTEIGREDVYNDQNRNDNGRRVNYDDYNRDFRRYKRNEDNCMSQCVFSYLELLDENRTPSETAVIKFLQENISNDRDRIQIMRDARRCFAKLITTEDDDGCEFSKSLSKCLQFELE